MPQGANGQTPASERRRESGRQRAFLTPFDGLLRDIRAAHGADVYCLYPRIEQALESGRVSVAGRPAVSLIANDYLGLGGDGRVHDAARAAITELGSSRCASPLVGGYTTVHRGLEEQLASFLGQESAAVFASGYQANLGVISALMNQGDLIVSDLQNHASIVDGARLSGAELRFFQHNDPAHLERILDSVGTGRRALVVVEGIYSADGDVAPLPEICDAAHAQHALVMVDEAHSLGVLGDDGRGAAASFDLLADVDLVAGTMSKSLGSVGGFVAGGSALTDVIRHNARSLIFSAALPPANAAAAATALAIMRAEPERRQRLWENTGALLAGLEARGLDTMGSTTPVVPVLVGEPTATLALTSALMDAGVLVCPGVPPMVQAHRSRIRMHVTAAHDAAGIAHALDAIENAAAGAGLREEPAEEMARA
ncbi:MAG TPA: pyridoxal phosphate-dependent aminotransferase family protein [Thermoleophilaceae bacterium]|nr:pyridoxal phosphate-dependent aminotransferase family protein [Thermoleophilaceae bacterium]